MVQATAHCSGFVGYFQEDRFTSLCISHLMESVESNKS